jgi:hypothetical protein
MTGTNGNGNGNGSARVGTDKVKQGLAQMLKGGVIVSLSHVLFWFPSVFTHEWNSNARGFLRQTGCFSFGPGSSPNHFLNYRESTVETERMNISARLLFRLSW